MSTSLPEYMNESDGAASARLLDVLNPNYEDLSLGWGAVAPPPLLEGHKSQAPEEPEYLNTAQSSLPRAASLDNPDYQADFLPQTPRTAAGTTTVTVGGAPVPSVESHEYLGLTAALQTSVC